MTIETQLRDQTNMLQRIMNVLDVKDDITPLIEEPVNTIDDLKDLN